MKNERRCPLFRKGGIDTAKSILPFSGMLMDRARANRPLRSTRRALLAFFYPLISVAFYAQCAKTKKALNSTL